MASAPGGTLRPDGTLRKRTREPKAGWETSTIDAADDELVRMAGIKASANAVSPRPSQREKAQQYVREGKLAELLQLDNELDYIVAVLKDELVLSFLSQATVCEALVVSLLSGSAESTSAGTSDNSTLQAAAAARLLSGRVQKVNEALANSDAWAAQVASWLRSVPPPLPTSSMGMLLSMLVGLFTRLPTDVASKIVSRLKRQRVVEHLLDRPDALPLLPLLTSMHRADLAIGGRVIKCPPPSARAQRYIQS